MNPDRLAELEEERRFLLRSLTDLEREHAAGDVDEVDYRELRDGYTVRAAATLREIEHGRRAVPGAPPVDWRRRLLTGAGVLVAIVAVSWALIASSAERKPGQEQTGLDPRNERQVLMAQARLLQLERPGEAAAIYGQVLELDADDVEAMAYRGWTLALDAVQTSDSSTSEQIQSQFGDAIDLLNRATEADPAYPDPKCFLGIVYLRMLEQPQLAEPWVDECLAADPPADIRGLVEAMAADIDAAG
jgi:tetratricopeptide (TPR) repeat protein